MKKIKYLTVQLCCYVFIVVLLVSCNNKPDTQKVINSIQTNKSTIDTIADIIYSVPDPDEILDEIMVDKIKLKSGIANPIENADQYFESKSIALNIGVYLTDMAYLLLRKNNSEAIDYFKAITQMSNHLGIRNIQSEEMINYLKDNINNQDSIYVVFKESVYDIKSELEYSNQHKTLALIYTGSVIESLYLAINNINDNNFEIITEKILEQSIVVNNLYDFIAQYKLHTELHVTIDQLDSVKFYMNKCIKQNELASAQKDENDNLNIKGGYEIKYLKEDFERVKQKILGLRNNIIAN